jgi:hypothetical protein
MLKRQKISKLPIQEINQHISAYERMLDFYQDYLNTKGDYIYVNERVQYLNGKLAECLIAREIHIEENTQ